MTQPEHPKPAISSASSTSSASSESDLPIEFCPNCSSKLVGRSCKMKCPLCGYFLSCSDYY
jgi:hypothetical protein